jgi:uncharacterized protein (DUF1697 family)
MTRYVALLRGVSPVNASMPELQRCFEAAGFANVRTLLASGNIAFDARTASEAALERRAEAAMHDALGRSFYTIVRSSAALQSLLDANPFAGHALPAGAKRVVSFLREAREPRVALPLAQDQACVLALRGREAFTAYVPGHKGPVFMKLIETAFGRDVTTRTWDTVAKCAKA